MNAVDLFAGAGGWSLGFEQASGCSPLVAVNHCEHAVHLHTLNHPSTQHFLEDVRAVDPAAAVAGRRVDWLHLSPDCTHLVTTPPASKKNGKRWLKRGRKTFLVPSAKAVASERDLASAARLAISRSGAAAMPFDQEDTIRLDVIHDIDTDMVHVRVSKIGLLPERTPSGRPKNGKKLGTKRDTHGMIETIADALQGVVYPNDRQVDAGTWEKQR